MVVDVGAIVQTILDRKTGYLVYERVGRDQQVAVEAGRRQLVVVGFAEDHTVLEEARGSAVRQHTVAPVTAQAIHVPELVVHVQTDPIVDQLATFAAISVRWERRPTFRMVKKEKIENSKNLEDRRDFEK